MMSDSILWGVFLLLFLVAFAGMDNLALFGLIGAFFIVGSQQGH